MPNVIDMVAATEFEPVEGVTADALDVTEVNSLLRKGVIKALEYKKEAKRAAESKLAKEAATRAAESKLAKKAATRGLLFPDLAKHLERLTQLKHGAGPTSPVTVQLPPRLPPRLPPQLLTSAANVKKLIGKAPPAQALIIAYETGALLSSEKQREKAWQQSQDMAMERGYRWREAPLESSINAVKNGLQGALDPVGTIYGAGRGLKELIFDE